MSKSLLFTSIAALAVMSACQGETKEQSPAHSTIASSNFPRLTGRVVDEAQLLRPEQEIDLAAKSQALETQTGLQLVIVTVTSLAGHDAATYTRDLGNAWKIGRKGYNDGTILLVAPNEREVRIATGEGLAQTFPDATAKRIIDTVMLPKFREGHMDGGIIAGADAIAAKLSQNAHESVGVSGRNSRP